MGLHEEHTMRGKSMERRVSPAVSAAFAKEKP
jgi:hypothetical protein